MSFPCRRTTLQFLREVFSHPGNFSIAPAEIRDSNNYLCCSIIISFNLHSRRVHPKCTWTRNDVASSRSTFIHFFHIGAKFCFFPAILMSSTSQLKIMVVFFERTSIPNSLLFSKFQQHFFELPLPQPSSKWVSVSVSLKRNNGVFNILPRFGPFVSWKTYPNIWTC